MIADSFLAFLTLFGFLVLFYGPWQAVCTDVARQLVFEQRDKIFDMARAGMLDFRSPEYRDIRLGLESSIRFAHELTLTRLLFLAWSFGLINERGKQIQKSELLNAVERIKDENTRSAVKTIVMKVYAFMVLLILAKSLIFWIFFPLVVTAFIVIRAFTRIFLMCKNTLKGTVKLVGEVIQIEAECV